MDLEILLTYDAINKIRNDKKNGSITSHSSKSFCFCLISLSPNADSVRVPSKIRKSIKLDALSCIYYWKKAYIKNIFLCNIISLLSFNNVKTDVDPCHLILHFRFPARHFRNMAVMIHFIQKT